MPGTRPPADEPPLRQLGSYRLIRQLGSGGMSSVFEATHVEAGSRVAVKVLPRTLAQNPVLLQRFLREAKSAEALDHPHIVAIYDRGFDQGRHYLVLEYVAGSDLADRVRTGGPMTTAEALAIARQVATGLQYASGLGMIHRDIKPANLLLTPEGFAKIIDLGLALQAAEEDERVTRDGTTVGTVDYMSPEQARDSRKISERSDIYSLGCTLHYLVTGSPPYPGGTLADKLARHHAAPAPDARALAPTTPADFVALVQKMMAKKPEERHRDYQELIDAIDRIGAPRLPDEAPPLQALLDDDEDDFVELTLAGPAEAPKPEPNRRERPPEASTVDLAVLAAPTFSLAELAALESDDAPSGRTVRQTEAIRGSAAATLGAVDFLDDDLESDVGQPLGRNREELPLQTWIAAGVVVGLVLAVVAFGVAFVLTNLRPAPPDAGPSLADRPGVGTASGPSVAPGEVVQPDVAPSRPVPPPASELAPGRPRVGTHDAAKAAGPPPTTPARAEVVSDAIIDRLGMRRPEGPRDGGGATVRVRRLADPGEANAVTSLAAALGRPNEDVEVADAGPIHEDDFTIAGRSRAIRAKQGLRPIVKIEFARQQMVRDQPAKFLLGGGGVERLTIEGLDLVVDVRDLPLSQSTLFQCEGVDLTIRDCTITVEHAEDRRSGYSLFRCVESSRPNRVTIERSLIRGPVQSLVEFEGGRSELLVDRSVVLGANLSLIQVKSVGDVEDSIRFSRSVLVSRAPIVRANSRSARLSIRSLDTTFARAEGGGAEPWIVGPPGDDAASLQVDYDGEANRWFGWAGWSSAGAGAAPARILDAIHRQAPVADRTSVERPEPWSSTVLEGRATASALAAEIPDRRPMLDQVAIPRPYLHEMTVGLFPRPPVPAQAGSPPSWAASDTRPLVSLSYDPAAPGGDDFGVYLAKEVLDPGSRYQIQVPPGGPFRMSPTRLPDGVAVSILGPPGQGNQQPIPTVVPARAGAALIELRRGSLTIANLGMTNDGPSRTGCGISIEDGLLVLNRFLYRDLTATPQGGDAAIRFRAGSADLTTPLLGGLMSPVGLPTLSVTNSWVWTNSVGLDAGVDRGVLQLENCVIHSAKSAIELRSSTPEPPRREATLLAENCTVVAERFAVSQEGGPTGAGEVGRPWVIISRACVFPRPWKDTSTLLGVDPDRFAAGSIFWQSSNDIYDVGRFVASNKVAAPPAGGADLKRQWVDLWGIDHTRGDRGPDSRKLERLLLFRDKDRSRTSRPNLAQLELDAKTHKAQGADFSRLPPTPR